MRPRLRLPLFPPTAHIRHSSSTAASLLPLSNTHALVTGASRGIGLATARHLASLGASLTLVSRSAPALAAALATLPRPETHAVVPGDVGSRAFWAEQQLGSDRRRVDVLVHAAGVSHASPFLRTSEEMLEDVVRTNLLGTMWACRSVGRWMLRQPLVRGGRGVIVNVASLLAVQGGVGSAAYAASKAGVVGFTRALAAELGPSGIRVNTVLPGYVSTDMTDGTIWTPMLMPTPAMTTEARDQALSRIPLKRFGSADEVADAVSFLIQNAYAHNCVLNLDGGLSATVSKFV